ncbi:YdbH domain-containing protein [Pseudomonas sp. ABC1]|uniref:intermembrane phospholipid transport protein YdbH family protein n=1 Tax=Pseudomonas sp. ABC1 TaxID=2748080 RepID=UPI0015C34D80|nr:YdbH domain-containing protein [Pseudomonas sp. ABC1]QLF92601.1 YdbH domain-containing protein [Pseudomonas sp. ABC1]
MRKSFRWLLCTAALIVMLAIIAGLYGQQRWHAVKQANGITALDWKGLGIARTGITLESLTLQQALPNGEQRALTAQGLRLDTHSLFSPLPLRSLHIDHLLIAIHPGEPQAATAASDSIDPAMLQQWAAWIPEQGTLPDIALELPCATGQCRESLALHWQHGGQELLPVEIELTAQRDMHSLTLAIQAVPSQVADLQVDARLSLDGQPRIFLHNLITSGPERWTGSMTMGSLPEAPWLLAWLSPWLPQVPQALPSLPEQMHMVASWALDQPLRGTDSLSGEANLDLALPEYWPLPGLGLLKGNLNARIQGRDGLWLPSSLSAALAWQPPPSLLEQLPPDTRPSELTLDVTPQVQPEAPGTLPLYVQLRSKGNLDLRLDSALQLHTTAPDYRLDLQDGQLRLSAGNLAILDHRLNALAGTLRFNASIDREKAELRLTDGSNLTLGKVNASDWSGEKLHLKLKDAQLLAALQPTTPEGPVITLQASPELSVQKLSHTALKPQGWQWQGKLQAHDGQVALQGPLSNDAGLGLQLKVDRSPTGVLAVTADMQEIFFRAGNPLSGSFSDWPQTLALDNGRLNAKARLDWSPTADMTASLQLDAKGLAGIYARSELSGLDIAAQARLSGQALRVEDARLNLQQLNVGFPIGPLRWQGQYQATLQKPAAGHLQWQTAETRLLGGHLWLDAGDIDLAASEQRLALHLEGLQIPELLRAYPAEGLAGTGIIDGNARLRSSAAGYSVDQGLLSAREPGGILRFRSAKIQALGQSNPAMKIVAQALDDFHYSRLDSDVRYDERGKLQLGLRLHGNNPTLEGGRPINFSINLEEDIPALLTSLQLSDRVSETIQRRVQQSLQRDKTAP